MSAGERPPREVLVRFVRTGVYQDQVLARRARAVLGADERKALGRLRSAAARRDYLAAHALARRMLAELAGSEPGRLCFRDSPWGRPEIVAPPSARCLCFSLSHADGVALCAAAAQCHVGADVESLRNVGPDPLRLAETVCSRREKELLRAVPRSAQAERLLCIWTLKEAIAKAMGLGFHFPFAHITIHWTRGGAAAVEFDPAAAEDPSRWRLASFRLTPYHVAAVAVLSPPGRSSKVRTLTGYGIIERTLSYAGKHLEEDLRWLREPWSNFEAACAERSYNPATPAMTRPARCTTA